MKIVPQKARHICSALCSSNHTSTTVQSYNKELHFNAASLRFCCQLQFSVGEAGTSPLKSYLEGRLVTMLLKRSSDCQEGRLVVGWCFEAEEVDVRCGDVGKASVDLMVDLRTCLNTRHIRLVHTSRST